MNTQMLHEDRTGLLKILLTAVPTGLEQCLGHGTVLIKYLLNELIFPDFSKS